MRLDEAQRAAYEEAGYLLLPRVFPDAGVARLLGELPRLGAAPVSEVDGSTLRSLYGSHLEHELFASLTCHPAMLQPARELLGGDVYVYQMKINFKSAVQGDVWPWHQDLIYWQRDDGLPGDEILSVVLFLDDATGANGALQAIPGSHRRGVIDVPERRGRRPEAYRESPDWIEDLIADLKYRLDVDSAGAVTLEAPRGSLLIFHPNLVHSSPRNRSAEDRRLLFITYNRVDNLPVPHGQPRPEFLVGRDYRPLTSRLDPRFQE